MATSVRLGGLCPSCGARGGELHLCETPPARRSAFAAHALALLSPAERRRLWADFRPWDGAET